MAEELIYKWYVLQVFSGSEIFVSKEINDLLAKKKVVHHIKEMLVPTKDEVRLRRGKKIDLQKKILPGYILMYANLTDEIVDLVKSLQRVSGFLTSGTKKPKSISEKELEFFMTNVSDINKNTSKVDDSIKCEIGETVYISEGPFMSFNGIVEEVDYEKGRLKLSVIILGRPTPVELELHQVKKNG